MMLGFCKDLLRQPGTAGLDLDSAEATEAHQRLIRTKGALRAVYEGYYGQFEEVLERAPIDGARVEIGSGGGFLGEVIDGLVTVDVRPGARVDAVASAMELPFDGESVAALFMLNVLHHLPDPGRFFEELSRVLVPGGRCALIEPYVSPLSRIIYGRLHHEPFDPERERWEIDGEAAMTSANDALPWIVFVRDRRRFDAAFPLLEVERITPHTVLSYLLSGGLSYRSLVPGPVMERIVRAERAAGSLVSPLASMMTVELARI